MNKATKDNFHQRIEAFQKELKRNFLRIFDGNELDCSICVAQECIPYSKRHECTFVPLATNRKWGNLWDNALVHITGRIPAEWSIDNHEIVILLELGGEILIYDSQGVPCYGLTNSSAFDMNYRKNLFRLPLELQPDGRIDFYAAVTASGMFGNDGEFCQDWPCAIGLSQIPKFAILDEELWQLMNDVKILASKLEVFKNHNQDARYVQLLTSLMAAIVKDEDSNHNAVLTRQVLKKELSLRSDANAMQTTAVGHAHIDTGWLWPVRETIKKCGRTFASQLANIQRYDSYVFGASQAQHYEFVRQYYPELFNRIKRAVADGRWEIQGGMWVEADCNLTSGESLIRQFLYGKNFFRDHFGVEVKNLWLPDVFGYSAALPQIMKKSGCNYLLTQKISWNSHNKFPHHTFWWHGIDKSKVLTHFPPEDDYNSQLMPEKLDYAANNFQDAHISQEYLTLFGIGDGGGGPKEEHIEHGLRCHNLEAVPNVKFGRADEFFQRQEKISDQFSSWHGELYLERHRGTYTSQGGIKRANRQMEQLLCALEMLSCLFKADEGDQDTFDYMWKKVLLNQFHDIIPGSSISEVYSVAHKEFKKLFHLCDEYLAKATQKLCGKDDGENLSLFNTLSFAYSNRVTLPESWRGFAVLDRDRKRLPVHDDGSWLQVHVNIKAQDFILLSRGDKISHDMTEKSLNNASKVILENKLIRYVFDADGVLQSSYDKEFNREVIDENTGGNVFELYHDTPNGWDAWDIDEHYLLHQPQKATISAIGKVMHSPVGESVKMNYTIGKSVISQNIFLQSDSKRLDFITGVDWREEHKMLRCRFKTQLRIQEATCDIQYGWIKRPTHSNTSWEEARFESVAHRYVDLTDFSGEYGAALLNDCKYGYRLYENNLDIALLRSSKYPDAAMDIGEHHFTYAFLPHAGSLVESCVISEAAQLNREPLFLYRKLDAISLPCTLTQTADECGVALEVSKRALKSNAVIVRLVEIHGRNSRVTLNISPRHKSIQTIDMVEFEPFGNVMTPDKNNRITLKLSPFEITTLILK